MSASLNDIALFVEVARGRSFTRAADTLNMPASTISRRISELERSIGVRLLNRSTRKVELTEAGALYFERCQHIVEEARIAHEQLLEGAQQPKGLLRMSIPSSFALSFLPDAIKEFSQRYPEIECEYDLSIKPIDLVTEPYDIVIRMSRLPDSGVVARQLGLVRLGLYASDDYLEKHGVPRTPAQLARYECLRASTSREDSIWHLRSGERMEHVHVKGRIAVNNVAMLTRMAVRGAGIVPLSSHRLAHSTEADTLRRILPEWEFETIPLVALFPSRLMPLRARVFIDFLCEKLERADKLA
ncbi:LysR family transcriptional regulator [Allopusillimonas soli]|uniref:LysR family transcriptional regulator n=1 Tax=Allopusillimonas soli TaxID=659016 RepID=A0A853FBL9_9BURK|nr:LysR family transcriptional regulator [Allopusillimonas soli]NYT37032.1 LysR family transcriptional regulator [Allopusillimonas soli]TEA75474.1 LysR family transcriptional regulator [Allopusillimonas soli]